MEKVPSPPPCISVVYSCLSPVLKDPSEFLRSSVFVSLQPLINCKCHFELKRNIFLDVRKSSHLFKRPCRSSLPPSTSVFVSRPAGLHTGWVWSKLQYSSLLRQRIIWRAYQYFIYQSNKWVQGTMVTNHSSLYVSLELKRIHTCVPIFCSPNRFCLVRKGQWMHISF